MVIEFCHNNSNNNNNNEGNSSYSSFLVKIIFQDSSKNTKICTLLSIKSKIFVGI